MFSENLSNKDIEKKKVFLVDDHPIIRHGIIQLISHEEDLIVCGEAEDARQALRLISELKPDIILVDISLKGMNGVELVKEMQNREMKVPILVVSMHDESIYAERVIRAGAKGYIMKHEATEKVILAIRAVLSGDIYLSKKIREKILDRFVDCKKQVTTSPVECLSDRELEIFRFIGQGWGTKQIAEELHLSVKTVEAHRAHLKEKLEVRNANELIHKAILWVEEQHAQ